MNYHSQIISPKGRKFHFDSIECMISYWLENEHRTEKLFVRNFSDFKNSKEWLEISNTFFLKSDKLISPMSANISSYKNLEGANKAKDEYGGKILDLSELKQYIRTDWKKELSEKTKH
ncbi:MAG: nitrous oxide reductase accessory protein NosL [Leptospiraceae bacterium]|nr:nitrous oxide reductase accessory protein NosL [Leptospiraceae bacterium]